MKKQNAHGCQFTNAYLASIPSELRVIIGADKAQVETIANLISETSINQVFSKDIHVISRYDVIDLRETNVKAEQQPTEEALVAVPAQTASKNTMEVTNEVSESNDKTPEQPSPEATSEAQNGDSDQPIKRKRGGRKPAS